MTDVSLCRGEVECLALLASAAGVAAVPIFDHAQVFTVDEWAPIASGLGVPAQLAKNVFIKGKKGELVLVFALADTKTDMKYVAKALGVGAGSLRLAPPETLLETLGVVKGSVTPLALVNDAAKAVTVVLDAAVLAATAPLAVHPCRNDKTVLVPVDALQKFFAATGHTVKVFDFAAAVAEEPAADAAAAAPAPKKAPAAAAAAASAAAASAADAAAAGTESTLGLTVTKEANFAEWYQQVITKSDMLEYYDVSGCYILRPWAFQIWECIRRFFGDEINALGVEDCYFPMFVSRTVLEREKDHIEGFAPEVAWVTRAGQSELEVPIAIRPTSETVMYPYFAKWIRSHRDLPVRLNQWCNVVRWEFSHPTPFIRTREFLWQEGHCAWATKEECDVEVRQILDLYKRVYEELLAVPVVQGVKTEKEKFAGGLYTTTVETFIPAVGRGCQGATSHNLGQNFGRMFGISFEDPSGPGKEKLVPWQNSWGLTTRTIGVATMVHGDNTGLVLPPRVASVQVVIIPVGINAKLPEADRKALLDACNALVAELKAGGVRAKADLRDNYTAGWRFAHWELKGVPVRVELGPKELRERRLSCKLRFSGEKRDIAWDGAAPAAVAALLGEIHDAMLAKARQQRAEQTKEVTEWSAFVPVLNARNLILAPWCGALKCEDAVKRDSAEESKALAAEAAKDDERAPSMGAKSLCIPYAQPERGVAGLKCICKSCTQPATQWVLFGRSF